MATIALCAGTDRPRTLGQMMHTRLGDVEWHHETTVRVPIRRAGIAQWIVLVDGLDVRGVKLNPIAVLHEGDTPTIDISKKAKKALIL